MYKQKKGLVFRSALASLLAMLFMVPVVYAQDDDADTFMLEEVTVTAEKRDTNLQKTPISIQTVSGAVLTEEAKTRIDDIMKGVVGVQTQGSQVGTEFFMRGIGKAEGSGPTAGQSQSAVAVVIDGVYQNRGEVVRGGTVDMAQAEVMRGTQSTTLGGSSLAGAVSLVSNNPVFDYEGSGSLGVGNYNLITTQAVLNVPVTDDQAFRIAYGTEKRDGYLSSNAGNSDQTNARLKYRWQPTNDLDLVATVSKQVIGGNGVDTNALSYYGYWEGYDEDNAADYDATLGYPALYGHKDGEKYDDRDDPWDDGLPADAWPNNVFRHTTIYQYSLNLDWDLSVGTLSVVPSYQTTKFTSQENPRAVTSTTPAEQWNAENRDQDTVQFDMQLASPDDFFFEWLAGLYYYDTEYTGLMYSANLNSNTEASAQYNPSLPTSYYEWEATNPSSQTTYAAYGNVSYPLLDVLRINAGLRYSRDEKVEDKSSRDNSLYGFTEPSLGDFTLDSTNEGDWDAVTYRVGGEYDLSDQAMVYALYATGYQPGQFSNGEPTDAQELDQYTVGLKTRMFGNRLQLNIEGFHSKYYNRDFRGSLQVFSEDFATYAGQSTCGLPGPPSDGATVMVGSNYYCVDVSQGATLPELVSMGADLEINYLLTENDRIDLTAEWLKSEQTTPVHGVTLEYLEAQDGVSEELAATLLSAMDDAAAAYDGLTLQNSPEWSANLTYSHIFDLPTGSTLTPKFNIEYKDTYYSSGGGPAATKPDPDESYQDAYELYNFYLNWTSADDRFTISGYVKNIGNTPILSNYSSEGMQTVSLLAPRTFGVTFTVKL